MTKYFYSNRCCNLESIDIFATYSIRSLSHAKFDGLLSCCPPVVPLPCLDFYGPVLGSACLPACLSDIFMAMEVNKRVRRMQIQVLEE